MRELSDSVFACLDVGYTEDHVKAACVGFQRWEDPAPACEVVQRTEGAPATYVPGEFWRRELPPLLSLLRGLPRLPSVLIVDGYVWLDGGKAGLGAHLFDALEERAAVVGVAKRSFRGADRAIPVLRGGSKVPLYVTARGIDIAEAASGIARMDGPHRIPTLLRRVDQLTRAEAPQ